MPTPSDDDLLTMDGWPRGVNNRIRETEAGESTNRRNAMNASLFLREAVNVDISSAGNVLRRKGYSLHAAGYTHSLWSHHSLDYGLCVSEGFLCKLLPGGTLEQLKEVHAYARMSYTTVNNEVYWSNGLELGVVNDAGVTHWTMAEAPQPGAAAEADGSLAEGTYQIAAVFVDDTDEEYGASSVVTVDVQEGQSLRVDVPGQWPTGAVGYRIFVSMPNGEILYEVATASQPASLYVQRNMLGVGRELETIELKAVKPGTIVRYFNGRIYVARRDTVFFTEALRYGLTRPSQGMYMFPSDVVMLEPVTGGVFVGHNEGVVFIAGQDPYDITQRSVLSHRPVPGAISRVPGEFLESTDSDLPVWWGADGAMVAGMPDGSVVQLTKDRLAVPKFRAGAVMYREQDGMAQVVSSLMRGEEVSRMAATDSVVAEVRRNTVKLNC